MSVISVVSSSCIHINVNTLSLSLSLCYLVLVKNQCIFLQWLLKVKRLIFVELKK